MSFEQRDSLPTLRASRNFEVWSCWYYAGHLNDEMFEEINPHIIAAFGTQNFRDYLKKNPKAFPHKLWTRYETTSEIVNAVFTWLRTSCHAAIIPEFSLHSLDKTQICDVVLLAKELRLDTRIMQLNAQMRKHVPTLPMRDFFDIWVLSAYGGLPGAPKSFHAEWQEYVRRRPWAFLIEALALTAALSTILPQALRMVERELIVRIKATTIDLVAATEVITAAGTCEGLLAKTVLQRLASNLRTTYGSDVLANDSAAAALRELPDGMREAIERLLGSPLGMEWPTLAKV